MSNLTSFDSAQQDMLNDAANGQSQQAANSGHLPANASSADLQHFANTYIKLFVGQVPKTMSEEELIKFFSEYGQLLDLSIIRHKQTGEHRGCLFVTFAYKTDADNMITAVHNQITLPGMKNPIQIKYADGEEERLEHKLFIGMLPKTITEEDIKELFGQFGSIEYCHVLRGPNDVSKGCAFLRFSCREEADNAIEQLNGTLRFGSTVPIAVRFADTERKKREKKLQQQQQQQLTMQQRGMAFPIMAQGPLGPQQQQQMLQMLYQQNPGAGPMAGTNAAPNMNNSYFSNLYGVQQGQQGQGNQSEGFNPAQAAFPMAMAANFSAGGNPLVPGMLPGMGAPIDAPQSEGPPNANLFIYHIPQEYGDNELRALFVPYGNVISSKVFIDKKTGQSKCFGFVSYDTPAAANAAITAMNGFQVNSSKRLKVQLKRSGASTGRPY